jgi:Na+-transporting NADH:ubiquinone oxidoreductase subunit A
LHRVPILMVKHKLKKGYDIRLAGHIEKYLVPAERPSRLGMMPPDFPGIKPKLDVEIGTKVKIGTPLFHDKVHPDVKFPSPASGVVTEINRGDRRAVVEVVVEDDGMDTYEFFTAYSEDQIRELSRDEIIRKMQEGGVWPYLRQRPFSRIARADARPRDIFINAMDTTPLAPDINYMMREDSENFQTGLEILSKLTEGKVYLSTNGNRIDPVAAFDNATGVERHSFEGPHPAGNTSVHVFHIRPMKVGDVIWYICAPHVSLIGRFFREGRYPVERIVAVSGSSLARDARKYFETRVGMNLKTLIPSALIVDEDVRFITGNVLSGRQIEYSGFVGFYDYQVTVIPDSNEREFFGWLKPGWKEESYSRTFLSRILPRPEYVKDTRMHGGRRAFFQTGEYEKMLPMDIYPAQLVKSIMAGEIEDMIGLGLLEVDEEDFALCTYICPSKIDFGEYVRHGLDMLEKEG